MRNIIAFAIAVMFVGAYMSQKLESSTGKPQASVARSGDAQKAAPASNGPRKAVLSSARNGHFVVDGRVDGRSVEFVVDTGATLVTLRESDAAKVNIRPAPKDYTATVSTANGNLKAARARLNRVDIGDVTIYDVDALVLPDRALGQNLLGTSFLKRLRRYEFAEGRMILEQ